MDKIAIIGLGYVGLPLAKVLLNKDYTVFGIDTDLQKIESIRHQKSYLTDISDKDLVNMMSTKQFHVSHSYKNIQFADVIIFCVPTPLSSNKSPNVSYIESALTSCLPYLKKDQLLILESSTYPGTTEDIFVPLITSKRFTIGDNIFVAYSPERIDPGQTTHELEAIPKIIGGITPQCTAKAVDFYQTVFQQIVPVSSAKVAEISKLVENAQRLINISFMNEIAMFCDTQNIDIWEVIEACSTKPFGFTPYYPGPGIGGHCIPVDPLFLLWKANKENCHLSLIKSSMTINDLMPHYIVNKVMNTVKEPIDEATIFIIGVTYKKDVNDTRESKALSIIKQLLKLGAKVHYFDPYIPLLNIDQTVLKSTPIDVNILKKADCTLILTDHSDLPYEKIAKEANHVIDTRNALRMNRKTRLIDDEHSKTKKMKINDEHHTQVKKILLVADVPGWAFDHHAKDMMSMPSDKVALDLKYSSQITIEDSEKYDLIYAMAATMAVDFYKIGIPLDKMIGGISSMRQFRFFQNEDKTFTKSFEHIFTGLRAVNTASDEFVEYFKPYRKIHKTRVGIDHRLFKPLPQRRANQKFTVGWVGSSLDNEMKGFRFVREALSDLDVKIDVRTRKDQFVTREEMIGFYQGLDCFVCSSSSEHIPLPILEAASCGVPIISTKVGIVPELIQPYENGIIVERNATSIRKAVKFLKDHPTEHDEMAKNIRDTILDHWTWDICWEEWEAFFTTI